MAALRHAPSPDAPQLMVASDETADRIFAGRCSLRLMESPEPDIAGALREIGRIRSLVGDRVAVCVTVKSKFCRPNLDRYAEVLRRASAEVPYVAVASVDDAVRLRMQGVTQRILLLYVQDPGLGPFFERFGLEPAAASAWWLQEFHRTCQATIPLHVWVDTGLGREGVLPQEAPHLIGRMRQGALAGLGTHLAAVPYRYPDGSIDEEPRRFSAEFTREQCRRFDEVSAAIEGSRTDRPLRHAASSAAIQHDLRPTFYDMVRPGRLVVERFARARSRVSLAIETRVHHARVADVKRLPPGWSLGYLSGGTLATQTTVAVLTTSAGTDLQSCPISLSKGGRRYTLPVTMAHGGMCVVRADHVPIEPGDVVDLNPPSGARYELYVPLGHSFDGALHDPIRGRTLAVGSWPTLRLRLMPASRDLSRLAARPRYWIAP